MTRAGLGFSLAALSMSIALFAYAESSALTIHVPSEQPTIQAGLNSANGGDTVRVASGVYSESIFWPAQNGIVLVGAGMDSTVVDGGGAQVAVFLPAIVAIDTSTVIRGLRIRNGGDAGLALNAASPLVDSCAVDSTQNGPGIACSNGSNAVIRRCHIADNPKGGISILYSGSSMVITRNRIIGNGKGGEASGAGIYCYDSSPTISENLISDNGEVTYLFIYGGGMYLNTPGAQVLNNTVTGNHGSIGGGIYLAVACSESPPAVTQMSGNTITDNVADELAGGIFCAEYWCPEGSPGYVYPPHITNNVIENNTPSGVYIQRTSGADFRNNMVVGNAGNGVRCEDVGLQIVHNIICDNAGTGLEFSGGSFSASDSVTGNTIVGNGYNGVYCFGGTPELTANTITDNGNAGIYTRSLLTPTILKCNIARNGQGLYHQDFESSPAAKNNWWGDASGPWHQAINPAGLGDSLSLYAWDFVPWLTEPDTLAPPLTPTGVIVSVDTMVCTSLIVSWDAVPGGDIAGYTVYFSADSGGYPYDDSVSVGNTTMHTLGGLECQTTYYVSVRCFDTTSDESWYSQEANATTPLLVTGTGGEVTLNPQGLRPNYPNPFNPSTTIPYTIAKTSHVLLAIYDVNGRLIRTLANDNQIPGDRYAIWNGRDNEGSPVASGVYFVRLVTGASVDKRKMVLLK